MKRKQRIEIHFQGGRIEQVESLRIGFPICNTTPEKAERSLNPVAELLKSLVLRMEGLRRTIEWFRTEMERDDTWAPLKVR